MLCVCVAIAELQQVPAGTSSSSGCVWCSSIMVFRLCVGIEELEQVPAAIDSNGDRKEDEKHEGAPVGYDPNRIQVLRLKKLPRVTRERE